MRGSVSDILRQLTGLVSCDVTHWLATGDGSSETRQSRWGCPPGEVLLVLTSKPSCFAIRACTLGRSWPKWDEAVKVRLSTWWGATNLEALVFRYQSLYARQVLAEVVGRHDHVLLLDPVDRVIAVAHERVHLLRSLQRLKTNAEHTFTHQTTHQEVCLSEWRTHIKLHIRKSA